MKNSRITKRAVEQLRYMGEYPDQYLTHFGANILLKDSISGIWLINLNYGISTGSGFNQNFDWGDYMYNNNFKGSEISNLSKALQYAYKYQKKWMVEQKKDKIELKIKNILKKSNVSQEQINKLIKLYLK